MVVEQDKGKVVPGYLLWFCDPVTFGDIPEGSSRKRKDQHIIIQLEKELEKAKATIARQEVQVQEEEITKVVHYQKGDLKRQKEKSEKERSHWMCLHDQLNAQLEEHKRKISHCVDIEEGQRQMIIERKILLHQLEATEEREALLRNNLGDHQHRRMNDPKVAEQAWAIVPHLPKVLLNLLVSFWWLVCGKLTEQSYFTKSKVIASMTSNTETTVNPVDTSVDSTTRDSATVEVNWTLRHANGQEPPTSIPGFPKITSIRSSSSQVQISGPFFPPGPLEAHPQGMPHRNNPTIAIAAPIYTLSQPTMMQRAAQEKQFTVHPKQYYTPGIAFGA
ncbi:hypothetical protein H5410_014330 [Solanum commersonii]|uniref:Uncharacterized protein n=1 Tax=Solanum commersonii TaxID=4109 RepID=A0A9J5ZR19_SOLCO|nr:hypothetical protein H5410_014330 [Solanum commersonii]